MNIEHFFEWETHQIHVSSELIIREGDGRLGNFFFPNLVKLVTLPPLFIFMAIVKNFGLPLPTIDSKTFLYFPIYEFPKHDKRKVFLHSPSFRPKISIGIPYPMSSLSNYKNLEKDKVV